MAAKRSSRCAICEGSNLAAVCAPCVNHRLNEYNASLKSLKNFRESLYNRLRSFLEAKKRADDQLKWRIQQKDKITKLRYRLNQLEKQLSQEKAMVKKSSNDLNIKFSVLDSSFKSLEKSRVEVLEKTYPNYIHTQNLGYVAINYDRLCKQAVLIKQMRRLFPMGKVNTEGQRKDGTSCSYDQICNARLPQGLDPHSVPSEELAASLGYMLQLLNLVIPCLAAPTLHNAGFAGSCSRIWQRDSYWDARPSSQSKEYPLFIPRQSLCSSGGENSWSDRSSSNFGVSSVESVKKPYLDPSGSSSFNYSSASPHSSETHKDLQKGISLLKKSVACITAYGYNSLGFDVPSEASTFEAFSKLLLLLSSSNLKPMSIRSGREAQKLNKSVWHVNSLVSSSSIADSMHTTNTTLNTRYNNLSSSAANFFHSADVSTPGKSENPVEGWDFVEHFTLPPPPSEAEDVEHWTRAMFTDATRK